MGHSIDLIVIGTQGRGAVEKMWVGTVTDKVLRKAHCPVLATRPAHAAPLGLHSDGRSEETLFRISIERTGEVIIGRPPHEISMRMR